MKRRRLHHIIPATIMTGAALVPVLTTVEILAHAQAGGPAALQPPTNVSALPPKGSTGTTSSPASASGGTRTFAGQAVNEPFGTVQATITVSASRITGVSISAPQGNPRSASINQQAVPMLRTETLQAQSANINAISGATYTSQAYIQSLQSAVSQAHAQAGLSASSSGSALGAGNPAGQQPSISNGGDD